eukprot:1159029-Pelagomonas_calceolata.AAC.4
MAGKGCARWEAMASLERQLLHMLITVGGEAGSSGAVQVGVACEKWGGWGREGGREGEKICSTSNIDGSDLTI